MRIPADTHYNKIQCNAVKVNAGYWICKPKPRLSQDKINSMWNGKVTHHVHVMFDGIGQLAVKTLMQLVHHFNFALIQITGHSEYYLNIWPYCLSYWQATSGQSFRVRWCRPFDWSTLKGSQILSLVKLYWVDYKQNTLVYSVLCRLWYVLVILCSFHY